MFLGNVLMHRAEILFGENFEAIKKIKKRNKYWCKTLRRLPIVDSGFALNIDLVFYLIGTLCRYFFFLNVQLILLFFNVNAKRI